MRLRTADNQAGARVFASANGTLYIRSDVAGQQTASPVRLTIGSWARLELCATAGPAGTLTLAVDGSPATSYTGNMGTAGFGLVEIGETANNNWSANFDDVVVDDPA